MATVWRWAFVGDNGPQNIVNTIRTIKFARNARVNKIGCVQMSIELDRFADLPAKETESFKLDTQNGWRTLQETSGMKYVSVWSVTVS